MKVLFDEGVPRQLAQHFPGNVQVTSAQRMGWDGKQNGELLQLARQSDFDALLTTDRSMAHQQNPQTLAIPVVVLNVPQRQLRQLGPIVSMHVVDLLQQGMETRFYEFGEKQPSDRQTPPHRDGYFVKEPAAAAWK